MSIHLDPPPSQGGRNLKYRTIFLENDDQALLQTAVNSAVDNIPNNVTPQGGEFLSEIQYEAATTPGGVNYSVMILVGEWNPA